MASRGHAVDPPDTQELMNDSGSETSSQYANVYDLLHGLGIASSLQQREMVGSCSPTVHMIDHVVDVEDGNTIAHKPYSRLLFRSPTPLAGDQRKQTNCTSFRTAPASRSGLQEDKMQESPPSSYETGAECQELVSLILFC